MDGSSLFSDQRGRLPRREAIALADLILRGERKKLPVNIIFADDSMLADLNSRFRLRRGPTDVLSFPADPQLKISGEIYISVDAARRQAREYGVTLRDEILRLVGHGVLHLCGYDHHRKSESDKMKKKENAYLGEFINDA